MDNVYPFQCQETIRAEARAWVLKFNGDTPPTYADISELREWVARSAVHRAELERAETFWYDADLLSLLAVPIHGSNGKMTGLGRVKQFVVSLAGFNRTSGAIAALACLVAVITLSFRWLPLSNAVGNGTYYTEIGEQKSLALLDKSQIQLDTNSKVRVVYNNERRQVYLLRGKAYFYVAENPKRPFEVYTRDGIVRAVGTAFSVYLTDRDVKVIVNEGRVDLARVKHRVIMDSTVLPDKATDASVPGSEVFLSVGKGQSASFNQQEEVLREFAEKELSKELAWRRGLLIFSGEPLSEVIFEISRYTSTTIEIADPVLSNLMIGGRFKVGELEALLEVLEAGFNVHVSYVDKNHIRLRASSP